MKDGMKLPASDSGEINGRALIRLYSEAHSGLLRCFRRLFQHLPSAGGNCFLHNVVHGIPFRLPRSISRPA
jgi:hypothetical protein